MWGLVEMMQKMMNARKQVKGGNYSAYSKKTLVFSEIVPYIFWCCLFQSVILNFCFNSSFHLRCHVSLPMNGSPYVHLLSMGNLVGLFDVSFIKDAGASIQIIPVTSILGICHVLRLLPD